MQKHIEGVVSWEIRHCKKGNCEHRGPHAFFYDQHGNRVFSMVRCRAQARRMLEEEVSKRKLRAHEMESLRAQIAKLALPEQGYEERRRESRVERASRVQSMTV